MGFSSTLEAIALLVLLNHGLCIHESGQDNVHEDVPVSEGSDTCNFSVNSVQQTLADAKAAFVPSDSLWSLLAARGALPEDVPELAALWSEAIPQRDEHGRDVYPFKVH